MPTIYERVAVCSDTTWNALSSAEQAEYDLHYNTWTGFLSATKRDLVTINQGCREVIVWDDFGELPKFSPSAAQIGTNNVDNYTILRAHSSARNNGIVGAGIKMAGVAYNYTINYILIDGFEFDEGTDGTTANDNLFINCGSKYFYFENCIFSNFYYCFYNTLNCGYYKNCLFYNWSVYSRNGAGCKYYNCGFYTTFATTYSYYLGTAEYYNCWAYTSTAKALFSSTCTGDNNYASDTSAPIAARPLATFGFTDPANGDFSIGSSSPMFDRGLATGNELPTDIAGNPRTQGARVDIGPFELVVQTIVTLEGLVVGSSVSIVDLDNGGFIVSPFAADATTETMEFSLSASTHVSVRVRNASGTTKYKPWSNDFLLTTSGATLYVAQEVDLVA